VSSVDDLIKYCENSGLPVALDENIDNLKEYSIDKLHQFVHPGIVAVVSTNFVSYFPSFCFTLTILTLFSS
jgi:hypothetical protein